MTSASSRSSRHSQRPTRRRRDESAVAQIRAQLDAMDGMVDDTIAFVLRAAAEKIRNEGDSRVEYGVPFCNCADLIDPKKQEQP